MKARKINYYTQYPQLFEGKISMAEIQNPTFLMNAGVTARDIQPVSRIIKQAHILSLELHQKQEIVEKQQKIQMSPNFSENWLNFSPVNGLTSPVLGQNGWEWNQFGFD